jgi:hypothetical protein
VTEAGSTRAPWRLYLLCALAWVIPGGGHFALGRRGRAAVFLAVIACAIAVGVHLDGNLYRVVPGQPLTILATLGAMGMGAPYFVLRYLLGFAGDAEAAGYEYGTVFLLSAGLMNLLLVLDTWDIGTGRKE